MQRRKVLLLFRASFVIAVIIFFTAILYDFSVEMYYSGSDPFVRIGSSFLAIFIMTVVIMLFLWWIPDARKAVLRMFGLDDEPKNVKLG